MLRKLKRLMELLLGVTAGVWLGIAIWQWVEYGLHPEQYVWNSAPWYTQLLVISGLMGALLLLEAALYWLIRHRIKKGGS